MTSAFTVIMFFELSQNDTYCIRQASAITVSCISRGTSDLSAKSNVEGGASSHPSSLQAYLHQRKLRSEEKTTLSTESVRKRNPKVVNVPWRPLHSTCLLNFSQAVTLPILWEGSPPFCAVPLCSNPVKLTDTYVRK